MKPKSVDTKEATHACQCKWETCNRGDGGVVLVYLRALFVVTGKIHILDNKGL